ncbi:prephenate dehydratase domain-containing protein, partial [Clostridioides difficile]|uniref:prephenate dehydratase domain-containing protein n=1 Tax=Clostridioides difficile TaxID=1496 RepID=UPI003F8D01D1
LVGFSGKSGSFTEEALNKFFNKKISKKQFKEFEDVFIALKNKGSQLPKRDILFVFMKVF